MIAKNRSTSWEGEREGEVEVIEKGKVGSRRREREGERGRERRERKGERR